MGTLGDTIVAIASGIAHASVGIVRLSGPLAHAIGERCSQRSLSPRQIVYATFHDSQGHPIDNGIALYFAAPASFTGEDIVELQGHGNPLLLQQLQRACQHWGARAARPGEFSQRAFLNGKIDLSQAEAIADLIASRSAASAQAALRSLQGEFAQAVKQLEEALLRLRAYIEAALDFPEEETDYLDTARINGELGALRTCCYTLLQQTEAGLRVQQGVRVTLCGAPNVGKSSLLNALSGSTAAIVHPQAGTTRDVIRTSALHDHLLFHLSDTAGLRDSSDAVEQEGIARAWREIMQADTIAWVIPSQTLSWEQMCAGLSDDGLFQALQQRDLLSRLVIVINKIDRIAQQPKREDWHFQDWNIPVVWIAAKTGAGLDLLRTVFSTVNKGGKETLFSARQRHIDVLTHCARDLDSCSTQKLDLLAEDLRLVHQQLGTLTGAQITESLLDTIFLTFCIGK